MKRLLNTLYITTPEYSLSLDGEAVKVANGKEIIARYPLLNFESIITHGHTGVSPALLAKCLELNITICFMSAYGKFLGRASGEYRGNVILRKEQYRISDDQQRSLKYATNFVLAKVYNQKWLIERCTRDHPLQVNVEQLKNRSQKLRALYEPIRMANSLEQLRGFEGEASKLYFACFDSLILKQKSDFSYTGRTRRPALDPVNSLLSYLYSLLAHDVASALEAVGLDPYVGFLHRDRPGRFSLALDLMEEFRATFVDRVVLTLINRLEIDISGFSKRENGAVIMDDETRKIVLIEWQRKKKEQITHPFLKEKMEWGLVPYVQALLLARTIRGEHECYPGFMYRV